jgi:hypothetical protein
MIQLVYANYFSIVALGTCLFLNTTVRDAASVDNRDGGSVI